VPEQVGDFCAGKRAVMVFEEGQPEYIEQEIATMLRRRDIQTPLHGKDLLPMAGEYTVEVISSGVSAFAAKYLPHDDRLGSASAWLEGNREIRSAVAQQLAAPLPARPPGSCVGCPERPVFSALKLAQQDVGRVHVAADIGCHAFGTFEPFGFGHSILGYGMSLASRAGVSPMMQRRTLSIMGDGGFWHNGLLTGVQSTLFNGDDAVLLIFKNGYTSATGTQEIISSPDEEMKEQSVPRRTALIERWLSAVINGTRIHWALGHELALCGRLIKGYGSTNERGKDNLVHIFDHLAFGPVSNPEPAQRAEAVAAARTAALTDEAGRALDNTLLAHGAPPRPVKAQPIRWMKRSPSPSHS
jgi:indolepyruvate ferredoxin oxidoreductase alpha subunit